jgi:hypothetical protein
MSMGEQTTLAASKQVADEVRRLREETGLTNDQLLRKLLDENLDADIQPTGNVEVELSEEVKEKRALVVSVLKAADEMGLKSDLVDLIGELRTQEMVPMCREITQHVLEKAKSGRSLNEADERLLRLVEEIETSRDYGTPAGQIADGLFGDSESGSTTRTATVQEDTGEPATFSSDTDAGEMSTAEDNSNPSAYNIE